MKQAKEAVESAKAAGALLLQVKASLPHGTWTTWLNANIDVSERQAQRYMATAKGKHVPLLLLANKTDTVSVCKLLRKAKAYGKMESGSLSQDACISSKKMVALIGFYRALLKECGFMSVNITMGDE